MAQKMPGCVPAPPALAEKAPKSPAVDDKPTDPTDHDIDPVYGVRRKDHKAILDHIKHRERLAHRKDKHRRLDSSHKRDLGDLLMDLGRKISALRVEEAEERRVIDELRRLNEEEQSDIAFAKALIKESRCYSFRRATEYLALMDTVSVRDIAKKLDEREATIKGRVGAREKALLEEFIEKRAVTMGKVVDSKAWKDYELGEKREQHHG